MQVQINEAEEDINYNAFLPNDVLDPLADQCVFEAKVLDTSEFPLFDSPDNQESSKKKGIDIRNLTVENPLAPILDKIINATRRSSIPVIPYGYLIHSENGYYAPLSQIIANETCKFLNKFQEFTDCYLTLVGSQGQNFDNPEYDKGAHDCDIQIVFPYKITYEEVELLLAWFIEENISSEEGKKERGKFRKVEHNDELDPFTNAMNHYDEFEIPFEDSEFSKSLKKRCISPNLRFIIKNGRSLKIGFSIDTRYNEAFPAYNPTPRELPKNQGNRFISVEMAFPMIVNGQIPALVYDPIQSQIIMRRATNSKWEKINVQNKPSLESVSTISNKMAAVMALRLISKGMPVEVFVEQYKGIKLPHLYKLLRFETDKYFYDQYIIGRIIDILTDTEIDARILRTQEFHYLMYSVSPVFVNQTFIAMRTYLEQVSNETRGFPIDEFSFDKTFIMLEQIFTHYTRHQYLTAYKKERKYTLFSTLMMIVEKHIETKYQGYDAYERNRLLVDYRYRLFNFEGNLEV